ncbi:protein SPIRRIG isoform X2 [Daucus carota subsp. sativus]|uniref:protein SPIRRIG isoform X2 n=1 Tax=Daucus carota subsp. sativus TaxID=79200 RepID=UPI0007EFC011|nr:PREDICTED: protein SPIRRIG isoform X2 [Daucus carota subsp. sativus]
MFKRKTSTMKWNSLLKDFRERVSGFSHSNPNSTYNSPTSSASPSSFHGRENSNDDYDLASQDLSASSPPSNDKHELELDFKRYWEDFRSSSSEKEKEKALNWTVEVFCRLVKQHTNVGQLITMLVETHIFSFVVGRAFVTDIDKLKLSNKTRALEAEKVLLFFTEVTKDGIRPGSNLLNALEVLVSGPIDKQSLLDSGILCCMIHILNVLLGANEGKPKEKSSSELLQTPEVDELAVRRLEIEASVVHVMKALSSHPSAAQSLIEDNSLQLLFQMVANGSLFVFALYKEGRVPLHNIQLHRHAMQILGLLLASDNGSTSKYIRKHQLIKVLLMAVKDFDPECGDPAYTMGIVDMLLECVELSYRQDAKGILLREDIHNAHGYQFLVQFALVLSKNQGSQAAHSSYPEQNSSSQSLDESNDAEKQVMKGNNGCSSPQQLSPSLSRLLDVIVNLAQTGLADTNGSSGFKGLISSHNKPSGRGRKSNLSSDRFLDETWEKDKYIVKDLEAVQMLQDIFLKADSTELQAEVLNRMFKIFSSHLENYKLCQQLRTVPLLILNMSGFPSSLQEIILKILEYAVTVVNCIPEQELLSLCCLLQQPITSDLKHTILSFFVKLLSFDQQYKKVLREVGVMEVLLDDLKQHKYLLGLDQQSSEDQLERITSSSSLQKQMKSKDTILSSPKLLELGSGKFPLFEVEGTIAVAWDCLVSLLKKAEANQASFRSAGGVTATLPFLISDIHRPGVLRVLSCLIIEDSSQAHPEELGVLVEVSKSGMVTTDSGSQYKLPDEAKCETYGALWRILGANNSAQRVFGEATGFSLLLTALHGFQSDEGKVKQSNLTVKLFTYLLRLMTVGVWNNAVNRTKLHAVISSQTFYDLLSESGIISVECERQVIQLLFELALEVVIPPFLLSENATSSETIENSSTTFLLVTPSGTFSPSKERVYNAGAIRVLLRSLLLFTPRVQLEVLDLIQKLASAGPFNQENLTSAGCVELLLEIIYPFLTVSSPLLSYSLKIVEVLGAYRLSASEFRVLVRYILQTRLMNSGQVLVGMMERLVLMEDIASESVSLAPFMQMDMSKIGHASIQVSMGERSWPPAAGYSFVCWFQYRNLLKSHAKEIDTSQAGLYKKQNQNSSQHNGPNVLRIFSVSAVDSGNVFYAELCLQEDGTLTLATSNSSALSFTGLEMEEGRWHHLAVVHSKPNALAGLFQASVAHVYLNGKLCHTGKLGYAPSPFGKSLQVTIGTPVTCARISDLSWKLRCCYLFEEVLTPGSICFMYILGRGYRGLFQDTNLLRFVPSQACGGGSMAILDSLDTELPLSSTTQRPDSAVKLGNLKVDRSGIVWDMERLGNLSLQLSGKKLIFAFDGTCTETFRASGAISMLNLVDPVSAAASPIGGIPRFGRLHGDIYVCKQYVIGDGIGPVGGMAVVLALVEAAETRDMLNMSLTLLACALHQNPQNVKEMQTNRGYHLLSLFLHRKMLLFDMRSLEIFFQIAACEASFSEPKKLEQAQNVLSPATTVNHNNLEDVSLSKFRDEFSSVGSHGEMDDFSATKDSFSHISELETADIGTETSRCIVLSNADMVEHVLLDWTLWVMAQVPIQISLLGFLENLVSMHWYRNHNLTILRRINLVQHLLVTLQRGDVEVPVLEKLVVLLGVILEDGFLTSELEHVVRFVIMSFDPPDLTSRHQITREPMGKHVIVRNMLLEMLIDLQMTIIFEDLLEQWHKIVSSKLITYFLDEAVHPTSMRWIMTLLGVCLASSPTFALKFRTSGGYQGLSRVLRSFYDSPDIYYILFCLIFGKPVYPRLPEVRMIDFHALMPNDGNYGELKFVEIVDSVLAMAKSTFDRVFMQSMHANQTGNLSQVSAGLVAELVDGNKDIAGELQGEALMHKTYAARLMGGEASAPASATAILRFLVDLAKMCPAFSAVCRRVEFLESCVELYFSCVRAAHAIKITKELSVKTEDKNLNASDDTSSSQNTYSSLPHEQEQSNKTSTSVDSFSKGQPSTTSDEMPTVLSDMPGDKAEKRSTFNQETDEISKEDAQSVLKPEGEAIDHISTPTSSSDELSLRDVKRNLEPILPTGSQSSTPQNSPMLSEKSHSKMSLTTSSSPVLALTSWLGGGSHSELKTQSAAPSMESYISVTESDASSEPKFSSHGSTAPNEYLAIDSGLLIEMDDSGYSGGPCSAGATAVLDFLGEVLSDFVTEHLKATPIIENILESVPLYIDAESVLVFQGLCLSRLMNFVERRLLRDDEENDKKLDKNRWSLNLDALCWMIVDRVYMGAFPQPAGVLRTLEFLLSMLQLANKDGRIEEAPPAGKLLLSITRGSRQLDAYIYAVLKNLNRMILYCFLPLFLITIGEDDLVERLRLQNEAKKRPFSNLSLEDTGVDISSVLQLLVANRRIVFCPSNIDTDLNCCLCINLVSLLFDQRQNVQNLAVDILKYLLLHRRAALEELLVSKRNQGPHVDVLHDGFDQLLTENLSTFFKWFHSSEQDINKVLEQCGSIMWMQYITGSAKFPGVRTKGLDGRRKREISRKSRDDSKLDFRHWEQINERRIALELVRDAMSTELRVVRQDKYGWVLHAESEWQTHLQQLVHERGILPTRKSVTDKDPDWQLCPIEGPFRMRKKLERCKLKIGTIQNVLSGQFELGELELSKEKIENEPNASDAESDYFYNVLTENAKNDSFGSELYDESIFKESDDARDATSSKTGWNDDRDSSIYEASLQSGADYSVKPDALNILTAESIHEKSDLESPVQPPAVRTEEGKLPEEKSDKDLNDNGEYLVRPYLEPLEKIKHRYNCERVVGLDKHDGIFLIGELCLYVIENFYIDESGCICEKEGEDELSVIDQALGVKKDFPCSMDSQTKSTSSWGVSMKSYVGGRAWAYNGGAWGKEKISSGGNVPHLWRMWKLNSVHEMLKRDYQLRPVAIEVFSMDGCNDLLVFHKKEREEVFKNLVAMNLPRNSVLDTTIMGSTKQESNEGSRLFKIMAKSFSKRWQNGEISNFQYLMHLNTLAGRGYSDLTQYPVFPWVLSDYESENLDLSDSRAFRQLDKPMGCQTLDGAEEFKKRYESWDDPEIPKFHYGSHYSSAGIVLFYLLRLPPFSMENQKLQGGQFDHADRLFNSVRETWQSAAGKANTSDVKELIPEFFYMPEFLENRFELDLGEKQSGEKVGDVVLPPWAKGSVREFIRKHREALECDYVSDNLHHWIDLIFGYKQRGKAAEEAVNVFYHYTYEGSVDIDSVTDPAMKASILAQINHFGQTPKQLFRKPHIKRNSNRKFPLHLLRNSTLLVPHEVRKSSSSISQIVTVNDKILVAGANNLLKPRTYTKYVAWGFPDRSLRFLSYDQDRLLSTHENLHSGDQIQCVSVSLDGQVMVTGADDGLLCVWRISNYGPRALQRLQLEKSLSAHTGKITCVHVSQPYMMIVSGSDDCTVILWDLSSLNFVRQLPEFPSPVSAIYVNDLTGQIVTAAGVMLAVWSLNGDCLAVVNTSQLPSDFILAVTSFTFSDWLDINWYVSGHQSGAVKVWEMVHISDEDSLQSKSTGNPTGGLGLSGKVPEYRLILHKVLKFHKHPVTALHLTGDLKQLLSGDSGGHLLSWTIPDDKLRSPSVKRG